MAVSTGSVILSPDYRLAPEHIFPAAIDDCYDSVNYVHENRETLQVSKIIITGDSAGGHLSITTALRVVNTGRVGLAGVLPIYPVTQLVSVDLPSYKKSDNYLLSRYQMAGFFSSYLTGSDQMIESIMAGNLTKHVVSEESSLEKYFGRHESLDSDITLNFDPFDFAVSPLLASKGLLEKYPPSIIYVSEHDVLRDDGALFHQRLNILNNILSFMNKIYRLVDIGKESQLVEWTGAIHAQVALSAQFAPFEADASATRQINSYFNDLKRLINS